VAPLKHYPDALFLDTTGISVEDAVRRILAEWEIRVAN
jgi:cytidylate kinase